MKAILQNLKIQINNKIYLKDPETSALGKNLIKESIYLIDEIGFDDFTFKKLGAKINSNESSIYRYFENKHKLLIYLSSWYWSWTEYKLVIATSNITDPYEKVKKAIVIVTEKIEDDQKTEHIDESVLQKIIISEFTKTLHTKEVDEENKEGFFFVYKRVINRIADMIQQVNPNYPFPKTLSATIVEGALNQYFSKDHFKTITDGDKNSTLSDFYLNLITIIQKNK